MKIGLLLTTLVIVMAFCSCGFVKSPSLKNKEKAYEAKSFIVMLTEDDSLNMRIRDTLETKGYAITDSCSCSPGMLLYGPEEGNDVERVERSKEGVAEVEDVEGSAGLNITIYPPAPPKRRMGSKLLNFIEGLIPKRRADSIIFYPRGEFAQNPRRSSGYETISMAIIDDGIYYADLLRDKRMAHAPSAGCQDDSDLLVEGSSGSHATKVATSSFYSYNDYSSEYKIEFLNLNIFKDGKGSLFQGMCAIRRAINNDVDVINTSWGFYRPEISRSSIDTISKLATTKIFKKILEEANNASIPIVAAAGNDVKNIDDTPFYPASFSNELTFVIGVGATKVNSNENADYTNFGSNDVKVFAVGAVRLSDSGPQFEGTSYAAPRVSVAAGMLHRRSRSGSKAEYLERLDSLKNGGTTWSALVQARLNRTP